MCTTDEALDRIGLYLQKVGIDPATGPAFYHFEDLLNAAKGNESAEQLLRRVKKRRRDG